MGQRGYKRPDPDLIFERNEVILFGLCHCPQGFYQGEIQGGIRADETPAHLFWRRAAGRCPAFPVDPGPHPHQCGGAPYGVCHASGLSAGAV